MSDFTFPPPPPPPPKAGGITDSRNYGSTQRGRGRGRGDRGGRDGFQGGGRGRSYAAGPFTGNGHRGGRDFSSLSRPPKVNGSSSDHGHIGLDGGFRGQKRKRDDFQRVPKPQTAPAVPNFGGPLLPAPMNGAVKPASSASIQSNVPKNTLSKIKANALGLTPYGDSSDDDGEDGGDDDEAAMAAAATGSGGLQISYRGKTLDLASKETLQAWLAERKRNWPTKARSTARKQTELKKQQESLRQKLEADQARRKAQESQREAKAEQKAQQKQQRVQRPSEPESKLSKVEKLRLKLEKAEAKAAAKASRSNATAIDPDGSEHQATQAGAQELPQTTSAATDLSEESSVLSSSDDDSSDSDAESGSTGSAPPASKAPISEPVNGRNIPDKTCHAFAAKGHCPRGRRCPYKHKRDPQKTRHQKNPKAFEPPKRKSLFQRFVEQEEAAEKPRPADSEEIPDHKT